MTSQCVRNFELAKQRHQAVEHFGDTTADCGGVDHLDGFAFELVREIAQGIDFGLTDDAPVIIKLRRGGGVGGVSTLDGRGRLSRR